MKKKRKKKKNEINLTVADFVSISSYNTIITPKFW